MLVTYFLVAFITLVMHKIYRVLFFCNFNHYQLLLKCCS